MWDTTTGQPLIELKGDSEWLERVMVSVRGQQVLMLSAFGNPRLWEADMTKLDPRVDFPPTDAELARRRGLARPRPEVHTKLAEEYKADPFASAVQKSLEQTAYGQLAVEVGDFDTAWGHFIAAEVLRPKPTTVREQLPHPRRGE